MFTLKIKNKNGEILNLSENKNYVVYKIEGLNPPNVNISQSANSLSDGGVINNARMDMRNIVLYISLRGDIEKSRIALYKYFPPKQNVTIYFKNDSRNVFINGIVESIECNLFSSKEVAQISIVCPQPYFKEIDKLTTNFSDINGYFEFPFSASVHGIELSSITSNIRKSIIYSGDDDTGLIMTLFASSGTVENPTIYDVANRIHMKLNFTMQQGDTIVINTNTGEKSIELIRKAVRSNAMGYLSQDSNWLSLHSGDNVFTYDCQSGGSNLQITMESTVIYSGV